MAAPARSMFGYGDDYGENYNALKAFDKDLRNR